MAAVKTFYCYVIQSHSVIEILHHVCLRYSGTVGIVVRNIETYSDFYDICYGSATGSEEFGSEGDAGINGISVKIETSCVIKGKICFQKYKDYEDIFVLLADIAIAVLVR